MIFPEIMMTSKIQYKKRAVSLQILTTLAAPLVGIILNKPCPINTLIQRKHQTQ